MSKIRLWTLGIYNTEHPNYSILPTKEGVAKLKEQLEELVNGGDLIWGPELSVKVVDSGDCDVIVTQELDGTKKFTLCQTMEEIKNESS